MPSPSSTDVLESNPRVRVNFFGSCFHSELGSAGQLSGSIAQFLCKEAHNAIGPGRGPAVYFSEVLDILKTHNPLIQLCGNRIGQGSKLSMRSIRK